MEICTISVDITAASAGVFANRTGALTSFQIGAGTLNSGVANALPTVTGSSNAPALTKSFTDDPALPRSRSGRLRAAAERDRRVRPRIGAWR